MGERADCISMGPRGPSAVKRATAVLSVAAAGLLASTSGAAPPSGVPGAGGPPANAGPPAGVPNPPAAPDLPDLPPAANAPNVVGQAEDVVKEVPPPEEVVPGGADTTEPSEPSTPSEPSGGADPEAPSEPAGGVPDGGGADPAPGGENAPAPASGGAPADGAGAAASPGFSAEGGGSGSGAAPPPERSSGQVAAEVAFSEPDGDPGADRNLSTRIGDLVASLPIGVLISLVGLGVLGLLMAGRSAWFVRVSRRLRLQRRTLQADVGALQAALVPDLPASLAGVDVSVAFRPAGGPAAGGDFHDVFELPGGAIGIVIGDVAGHGREALPRTGVVRYTIRAYLEAGLEPRVAIRLADRALGSDFDGDFASAVAATYEPSARRLVYSSAGHPQPIVLGDGVQLEVDVLTSPPIGIGHPSGTRQTTLTVPDGAEIWFFSDGLPEALRHDGAMLGRDGLRELLAARPDPEALLERLPGQDGPSDDLTACRLRTPATGEELQPFGVEALLVDPDYSDAEIEAFVEACGLAAEEVAAASEMVAAARKLEGQVLIRVSRLDDVVHCRLERVDPELGRSSPPVEGAGTPIPG